MEGSILVSEDILNMKFNKKDIYGVLCVKRVLIMGGFCDCLLGEIVGVLNDNYLLDFDSGNIYTVIDINIDTKNRPIGKYVLSPYKVYDKHGRVSPIDVMCDKSLVRKR